MADEILTTVVAEYTREAGVRSFADRGVFHG